MTTRKVAVFLELVAAQYLAAADKLIAKTKTADRAIDGLGRETDDLGRDLTQAAAKADSAARAIDDIGDQARGSAPGVVLLAHEIDRLKRSLIELRAAHTLMPTVGSAEGIAAAERDLRRLNRLARAVTGMLPGGGGGMHGGGGFDFSRFIGEFRGMTIAGLIGLAVAASPAIGAAIAGAVTGTVGGGGIIGGIVAASMNPRVKAAWQSLAQSLDMEHFAGPAFVEPTLAAITDLRDTFEDLDLDEALKQAAPFVQIFVKGISDLVRNLMPGLNAALAESGPFAVVFAEGLAETGAALADMLTDMAEDEGALMGLNALFDLLTGTLRWLGAAVRYLAITWRFLVGAGEGVAEVLADMNLGMARLLDELQGLSLFAPILSWVFRSMGDRAANAQQHFEDWNNVLDVSTKKAETAKEMYDRLMREGLDPFPGYLLDAQNAMEAAGVTTRDLSMSLDSMFDKLMGGKRAEIQFEAAMDDLEESIKRNGRSLDIHTEKGRANANAILDQVDAAKRMRDEEIARTGQMDLANQHFNERIELIKRHAEALGFDKEAIDALTGEYAVVVVFSVKGTVLKGLSFQGVPSFAAAEAATRTGGYGRGTGRPGRLLRPPSFAEGEVPSQHSYGEGPTPPPGSYPGAPPVRSNPPRQIPGFQHGGLTPVGSPFAVGERGLEIMQSAVPWQVTPAQRWMGASGGAVHYYHHHDVTLRWPDGSTIRTLSIDDARGRGVSESVVRVAYP